MERRDALKRAAIAAGSAVMAPSLLSILQSCKQQSRLDWTPAFLNEDQARFIAAFVDTLLPKTETPGALDVKVDIFLDKVFDSMYDQSGQAGVVAEIEAFNTACNDRFGDAFADLDQHDRAGMFNQLEKDAGKFNGKVWGTAVGTQQPVEFYRSLKSMTLWAYFTSEEVGKNILSYDPVPGAYLGCIPLSDVGNTWSL